jgi:hypothetical protein
MITYETIKSYREKVEEELADAKETLSKLKEEASVHERAIIEFNVQIFTLDQLLNVKPEVEMPIVDEEIMAEEHAKRLDFFPDKDPEEFFKERQEITYKTESKSNVDMIDALNRQETD